VEGGKRGKKKKREGLAEARLVSLEEKERSRPCPPALERLSPKRAGRGKEEGRCRNRLQRNDTIVNRPTFEGKKERKKKKKEGKGMATFRCSTPKNAPPAPREGGGGKKEKGGRGRKSGIVLHCRPAGGVLVHIWRWMGGKKKKRKGKERGGGYSDEVNSTRPSRTAFPVKGGRKKKKKKRLGEAVLFYQISPSTRLWWSKGRKRKGRVGQVARRIPGD